MLKQIVGEFVLRIRCGCFVCVRVRDKMMPDKWYDSICRNVRRAPDTPLNAVFVIRNIRRIAKQVDYTVRWSAKPSNNPRSMLIGCHPTLWAQHSKVSSRLRSTRMFSRWRSWRRGWKLQLSHRPLESNLVVFSSRAFLEHCSWCGISWCAFLTNELTLPSDCALSLMLMLVDRMRWGAILINRGWCANFMGFFSTSFVWLWAVSGGVVICASVGTNANNDCALTYSR